MADKTWVLTDVDQDTFIDEITLGGAQLGRAASDCRVSKQPLRGGLSAGVDQLEVNNGVCSFSVVPTRGMGIGSAQISDLRLGLGVPSQGTSPSTIRTADGAKWPGMAGRI